MFRENLWFIIILVYIKIILTDNVGRYLKKKNMLEKRKNIIFRYLHEKGMP